MCFHRNYRIYYSKRRSLKIVQNWHFLPSNSAALDDCDDLKPILLTAKVPLGVVAELSVRYDTYFTTDPHWDSDSIMVLQVYSREMATELIKKGSRIVVKKWHSTPRFLTLGFSFSGIFFIENKKILAIMRVVYS